MQISGYGNAQALDFNRIDRAGAARPASGFNQAIGNELGQKDQVSISEAGKAAQAGPVAQAAQAAQAGPMAQAGQVAQAAQAGTTQAAVLSASEKSFFNDSFGMNVFGAGKASGPVVSQQGASVLDSQEISFFQNSFGASSPAQASSYTRGGGYGSAYGQSVQSGTQLNRAV